MRGCVFTDGNPWFDSPKTFTAGNPLVQEPEIGADTGARATWAEGYAEYGLARITQIGHAALYGYGAATMISPFALGRDIFREDARFTTLPTGSMRMRACSTCRIPIRCTPRLTARRSIARAS